MPLAALAPSARPLAAALLGAVLFGTAAPGRAQDLGAQVEAFAAQTGFSGVVLLADGETVTVRTFGFEEIESSTVTRLDTRYQLGSVSKWLATLVAFRLADAGRLDLDRPISAYLPEYRGNGADRVTLHHLVTHTSGVPNGLMTAFEAAGPAFLDEAMTPDEAVARLASGDLLFEPGARFDYAHANWIVVQAILERVTGQPYAALVQTHLAAPLGLSGTSIVTGGTFVGERLAVGYRSVDPPERADARFQGYLGATGGAVSTAPDLLALLDALYGGGLLSPALAARLDAVVVDEEGYASGGRVRTMDLGRGPETVAWHTGSNGPSKARLARATASGLTVLTLSNTGADPDETGAFAETMLRAMALREGPAPPRRGRP